MVALVALSVLLQTFLVDQYGLAMEESLITILMVSSPGETGEYLGDLFFSRAMIDIVVALALFLLWWWLSPVLKFRPRRPEKIVGVLMLCPFAALSILFWDPEPSGRDPELRHHHPGPASRSTATRPASTPLSKPPRNRKSRRTCTATPATCSA